jgi:hypothetical protein
LPADFFVVVWGLRLNWRIPVKIAEGLLLRKQLEQKVEQLRPLKINGENGLFDTKVKRQSVSENVDEATIQVPRVALADITATYDFYASELRKVDAAIQKANWNFDLDYTEGTPPAAATGTATTSAKA